MKPNTPQQFSTGGLGSTAGTNRNQPMKTRNSILKTFATLCCATFAAVAAQGQSVFVWDAGGDGTNLTTAANWNPDGVPSFNAGGLGDTLQFNGVTTSNLVLTTGTSAAFQGFSGGAYGLLINLTASQVNSVSIESPVAQQGTIRFRGFQIDSGAAAFNLGNLTPSRIVDMLCGGTGGQIHDFINNSVNTATIFPNVRWRHGGGGNHTFAFAGSGNWTVRNRLRTSNSSGIIVTKSDAGTLTWTDENLVGDINAGIVSPMTINGGTVIMGTSTLLDGATVAIANNGTLLKYTGTGNAVWPGLMSGTGAFEVNNGSVTLSGNNTFSGNISLSGGTLIANSAENIGISGPLGQGGTVSFTGGTLQYSVANQFDYSSRFDTANGQSYSINSGGQSVTLATGLGGASSTFSKSGSGTVNLSGTSSFGGLTTVSAGKVVFQGAKSGTANITVSAGASLGVTEVGAAATPTALTVGAGSALEFNDVTNTSTVLLAAGSVSASGAITVNVNSGSFAIGQSYPLFSWSSGSAPAVSLGTVVGAVGNLSTNGSTIQLNITGLAYVWRGVTDGNWDTTTANNWIQNAAPALWVNNSAALFDDTATGETNILLNAPISTAGVTVNSSTKIYSMTSSGANLIGGIGGLTKNGGSTLTIAGGVNTYSGATTVSGGALSVSSIANGGAASDVGSSGNGAANLVINGGTLAYTGAQTDSDRLFTLSTANGGIASSGSGALNLTNTGAIALSGTGARTLTLSGTDVNDNTIAATVGDNGGATAITKSDSGKWVLTGDNNNSGAVTIAGGTLQVGNGGATGKIGTGNITVNGSLIFNTTGNVTNGTVTGTGTVTVDGGGKVVLPGNNNYLGGATILNGSTLQIGNGGATGSHAINAPIANDGNLVFAGTGVLTIQGGGLISGTGNVIVRSGQFKAFGANTYTGWTLIDPGAIFNPCTGNQGALVSSVVTNNGVLKLVRQDTAVFIYAGPIVGSGQLQVGANNFNAGDVTLTGTNSYTGGTFIGDNTLVLGDGVNPGAGEIIGNVTFTNNFDTPDDNARILRFNRPDDFTFGGTISSSFAAAQNNLGGVEQAGTGILTLTANNNYGGPTTVSNGTLRVNGNHTGLAATTVQAGGTLGGTGTIAGAVTVAAGGILAPGNSIGNLTLSSNLTIAGDLTIEVDRTAIPKNDTATVAGNLSNTGIGTLNVVNLGAALQIGDTFTIFNKPVANGAAITVTGGGAAGWINNLAVNGSITVAGPTLTAVQNGGNMDFTWTAAGFKLQSQTNSVSVGITPGGWVDVIGGGSSPVSVPIDATQGAVFFRLSN